MSSKDGYEAGVEHLAQFPEHTRLSFFLLSHNSEGGTPGPLLHISSQEMLKLILGRAFPPLLLTIIWDFFFDHSSLANDWAL